MEPPDLFVELSTQNIPYWRVAVKSRDEADTVAAQLRVTVEGQIRRQPAQS